ncbi:MAG: 50S ribosomal protein L4 [Candidatus Pacebacteria bacterium]|nr:50S ribosomal protein L4 [Candidatus Paceibacterota bacterium]
MKTFIYNQKGEKTDKEIELPKEVFEVPLSYDFLHQVVVSQASNRRQKIAKVKDRSEVRGGGRKPWRQKGTGRARHGSTRSPIWRGGGVTFGPDTLKVFKKIIPKKMKRKALFMVLSQKAKDQLIFVLDELKIERIKTKAVYEMLDKFFLKKGTGLIITSKKDENIFKSARNIAKVKVIEAKDLNALDLMSYKYIIMPKESIKVIKETFIK